MYGPNEVVGSSKNSGTLAALSLKILIPPFGSLLGDNVGSGESALLQQDLSNRSSCRRECAHGDVEKRVEVDGVFGKYRIQLLVCEQIFGPRRERGVSGSVEVVLRHDNSSTSHRERM